MLGLRRDWDKGRADGSNAYVERLCNYIDDSVLSAHCLLVKDKHNILTEGHLVPTF